MSRIYDNILQPVGHTPLVRLSRLEQHFGTGAEIVAKLESFNPGFSVKTRIAVRMIEEAEKRGDLKPGGTIVEGTSGNTGISLAMAAAAKGYRFIMVMPDNLSRERISIVKSFGAEVVLTPGELNMAGAGKKAAELASAIEGAYVPGQGGNPANPAAHYEGTGPEIWQDTDGRVDIFVAAAGTGGTVSGAGRYLKEQSPGIRVIAVEPKGSAVLSGGEAGPHKIQGIGGGAIPPVTDTGVFDEVIAVSDEDAYELARLLPRLEGISVGISSGAALKAAVEAASRPENKGKRIVVIIPDSGERYLSSDLYE